MKFEVTLKQLRENKACISGYNKVVCALKGVEYKKRETYMVYKYNEPISLISILETNGFDDALWCLRCNEQWNRDSRLFAVWCARQVQHLITDKRSLKALDVAEAFAKGLTTQEKLEDAYAAAWAAKDAAWAAGGAATRDAAWDVRENQKQMFIKMCNGEADWQVV